MSVAGFVDELSVVGDVVGRAVVNVKSVKRRARREVRSWVVLVKV